MTNLYGLTRRSPKRGGRPFLKPDEYDTCQILNDSDMATDISYLVRVPYTCMLNWSDESIFEHLQSFNPGWFAFFNDLCGDGWIFFVESKACAALILIAFPQGAVSPISEIE